MMPQEGEKRRQKASSVDVDGRMSSTTLREQILYLFDIVASLCAGFNEHDIQFLSSLLALLRGDLSAQVKAEGGLDEQTDMEINAKRWGQKEREEMERNKESLTLNIKWKRERG